MKFVEAARVKNTSHTDEGTEKNWYEQSRQGEE